MKHALLLSFVLLVVFNSVYVPKVTAGEPLENFIPQHDSMIKKFSPQLSTHCLGRYLIDFPKDLGKPRLSYAMLYFGLGTDFKTVEVRMPLMERIDRAAFDLLVEKLSNELKATFNPTIGKSMLLEQQVIETPNGQGILIRHLKTKELRDTTIETELHLLVQGQYVVLVAKSYPPESSFNDQSKDVYKLADPVDTEKRLVSLAQHLTPITDPERAGPGLCLNSVLIDQWRAGFDEERVIFDFNDTTDEQPKLTISLNGRFGYEKETLFDRAYRMLSMAAEVPEEGHVRKFRQVERPIGGMPFQEWADETYTEKDKATQYTFIVQNLPPEEKNKRLELPATNIILTSGTEKTSSLYSLPTLEKAWDQWLSTFRLSPGNGGKQR